MKRAVPIMIAAALALATAMPASAASKPWLGVYDCYVTAYSPYFIGMTYLNYQHTIRLKANGKYQAAFNHHGAKLDKPVSTGTWAFKAKKKKIVFPKGPWSNRYATWFPPDKGHPRGFFNEHPYGQQAKGASCYPTAFK